MANDKVDPFARLGDFKPKTEPKPEPISEDIERISRDNNFPSRQAVPAEPAKRARFGTGVPRKQLNLKVNVADIDRFYRIAEERQIRALGDLFAEALDALEDRYAQEDQERGNKTS